MRDGPKSTTYPDLDKPLLSATHEKFFEAVFIPLCYKSILLYEITMFRNTFYAIA